jgi:hypothetical protein
MRWQPGVNAYRSADAPILGQRRAEVEAARRLLEPELPALHDLRASRMARIVSGITGIVGAVAMVFASIGDDETAPTAILLLSGVAMIVSWFVTRIVVELLPGRRLLSDKPEPARTGHLATDLAAIEARAPWPEVEAKLKVLENASISLPLIALSLLGPLTLHYPVATFLMDTTTRDFSKWIRMSLVIVGFAHVILAFLSARFATKISETSTEDLDKIVVHRHWAATWGLTIAAGCVPGIVLLLVPPILVAITGIAFIPFMFVWTYRRLVKERAAIAWAEDACTEKRIRVRVDPGLAGETSLVEEPLPILEEPVHEPLRQYAMRL